MWDNIATLGVSLFFLGGWWLAARYLEGRGTHWLSRHLMAMPVGLAAGVGFIAVLVSTGYVTLAGAPNSTRTADTQDVEAIFATSHADPVDTEAAILGQQALFAGNGHAGCFKERKLNQLLVAATQADQRRIDTLLNKDCIIPTTGMRLSILEQTQTGTVRVRTLDEETVLEFWTVSEAIALSER
ncbi:hypothetical protein [Litchfieldella xinjiangensis]|uniref:hypothetical protein n=1 Tax=Litchfieldella xinjiangensis TaxID=1166948 RepID=UPI0012E03EF1|nr:hypothetical protein [Halomonas xinjiangensis]